MGTGKDDIAFAHGSAQMCEVSTPATFAAIPFIPLKETANNTTVLVFLRAN